VAAVTANVLGKSPRGQQWCRAIGLRFVNFRDQGSDRDHTHLFSSRPTTRYRLARGELTPHSAARTYAARWAGVRAMARTLIRGS
jgi:hypothetical protein